MTSDTDQDWKQKLTSDQYRVLRQKHTEAPGSGTLLHNDESGIYTCAACGTQLFKSDAKYDSATPGLIGWPSFSDALPGAVEFHPDTELGMPRTEVTCATCGGHLGHIFDDSASPNGKHYCINSVALNFNQEGTK